MKNPILKTYLIENGDFNMYSKYVFLSNLNFISKNKPLSDDLNNLLDLNLPYLYLDLDSIYSEIELKSLVQLFDSRRQKVYRLKKRITYMVENCQHVYFLTLTWRDEVLEKTSDKTRRDYVSRFLHSLNYIDYYANVDYGSEHEREHYHCVIALKDDFIPDWNYGFKFYEKVRVNKKSITKLSSYVNKLTYHAYKDSTKNNRCISPKKTRYIFDLSNIVPVRCFDLPFKE